LGSLGVGELGSRQFDRWFIRSSKTKGGTIQGEAGIKCTFFRGQKKRIFPAGGRKEEGIKHDNNPRTYFLVCQAAKWGCGALANEEALDPFQTGLVCPIRRLFYSQSITYLVKQFLWWFRHSSFPVLMLYFESDNHI
jgi:hypothetical protein